MGRRFCEAGRGGTAEAQRAQRGGTTDGTDLHRFFQLLTNKFMSEPIDEVQALEANRKRMQEAVVALMQERDALRAAVGELNERLHERTQGFLRRAAADKVGEAALHDRMGVAWRIINVLTMMDIDRAEPWPAALAWLEENEKYRPVAPVSTKEGA